MSNAGVDKDESEKASTYHFIEDVESLRRHRLGGYHVVRIGDRLNDRYEIINKLGFGTYSTVWLARDDRNACNVAVKIACSNNPRPVESAIISVLRGNEGEGDEYALNGRATVQTVLDEFQVTGPNGMHYCLVMPAARFSMKDVREPGDEHPVSTARAIAAQVAQGVAYLHGKGFVHGDLNLGNILLALPEHIKRMPKDQLYDEYGEPEHVQVKREDRKPLGPGVPQYGMIPMGFAVEEDKITLSDARVILSDFGESYQPSMTPRTASNAPGIYRPPEQFLRPGREISFESDVWALGCVIFAMLGYRHLADLFGSKDFVLLEYVDALGPFPVEMWEAWANRGKYFTEDQQHNNGEPRRDLHERVMYSIVEPRDKNPSIGQIGPGELRALEEMLRSIFALKVEDRPTTQQALESEWMTKWALPDLERARQLWEQAERNAKQTAPGMDEIEKRQEEAVGDSKEEHGSGEGSQAPAAEDKAATPPLGDKSSSPTSENECDKKHDSPMSGGDRRQSDKAALDLAVKKRGEILAVGEEKAGNLEDKEAEVAEQKGEALDREVELIHRGSNEGQSFGRGEASAADEGQGWKKTSEAKETIPSNEASADGFGDEHEAEANQR